MSNIDDQNGNLFRYYENRTGERFSASDGRLNSISMEIDTVASSINATVSHVQSMYKYINVESSSCQSRMGRHSEDLQVGTTEGLFFKMGDNKSHDPTLRHLIIHYVFGFNSDPSVFGIITKKNVLWRQKLFPIMENC